VRFTAKPALTLLLRASSMLPVLAWIGCTEPVLIDTTDRLERLCEGKQCSPCQRAQDCRAGELCEDEICIAPKCGDGIREGIEQCDDANDNPYDTCHEFKSTRCGDSIKQTNEECEIGVGGRDAWTRETCHPDYCRRTVYQSCAEEDELSCPERSDCVRGVCAKFVPLCIDNSENCEERKCPTIPGFRAHSLGTSCFLECGPNGKCPSGLVCARDSRCVGTLQPGAS